MRAITHDVYGEADVLRLTDLPTPEPAPDEVVVRVHAAGLDRGVWHLMAGRPLVARLVLGLRRPKSGRVGQDLAGTVEAVGSDVTEFAPGDAVFGAGTGSFAEFAVAKPRHLAPKPAEWSFVEAAAVPTSALTALQALRRAEVTAGTRLLVIGAGSGVGTFVVPIAKALGAEVTAVVSPAKIELVRSLGADAVVDYTTDGLGTGIHDVILDIAGNRSVRELRRVLAPRGTVVFIGGESGGPLLGGLERQLGASVIAPFTGQRFVPFLSLVKHDDLVELADLGRRGVVRPVIERTFPLEQAADALRHIAAGHAAGKTVITVV